MSVLTKIARSVDPLVSLFYPPHCAQCSVAVERGNYLCPACKQSAKRITAPFCQTCSQPFDGAINSEFSCANCAQREFHFQCAVTRFRSVGVVRELIHRFKYGREVYLRHPLADWLMEAVEDERITAQPFDCFVPVPLHSRRTREREFNQAEALSHLLSARTGIDSISCLERIRYTTTQTRYDRTERMENLRNAFQIRQNAHVQGRHLILVDDVLTTGSTIEECARCLKNAGALSVRAVTVARG